MAVSTETFYLVGPREGQTVRLNGKVFVDGRWTFRGSSGDVGTLQRILGRFFSALPKGDAEAQNPHLFQPGGVYFDGTDDLSGDGHVPPEREGPSSEAPAVFDVVVGAPDDLPASPDADGSGLERPEDLGTTASGGPGPNDFDFLDDPRAPTEVTPPFSLQEEPAPVPTPIPEVVAEPASPAVRVEQGTLVSLPEAIGLLDPNNDDHWTATNIPALDHLALLTGAKVSRLEVNQAAPGYNRAAARRLKAG